MGSQVPASNDRSRTYWTPTMERYFIDLMLEHMRRGNRTGHTFNKQAWTDILSDFNEKFKSRYDKDVLKSRYTNMWKQFNDIKSLLGQGGFSWDETRQKVVADDYAWDNYIKAHPDARTYKTKAVLNFSDLCLIYGYTTADGLYSRSSHDIDIDDDVQRVNLGDEFRTPTPNAERSRTDWIVAMDQYFIELLLNQQENGNKLDNTYSKQAWNDMLTSFNAKFGPQHTKRVLRHRYKKLYKYYNDIAVLLKQNGFSWDDKRQMVAANDDVWDAYIKAHPNSRSYRTKSLPNYKHLALIFGSAISTQSLNPDKDFEGVGVKNGSERSRTYWTPPMDRYLIDLLHEQVNNGNRIGQTFVAQAWIDMVASFNAKFRSHHDKDVLKNRYKHLKRQHCDIKILLEQSGFSWDKAREMVAAEDHIWDAYIEVHPDARSYRVKTVPSYDKLCIIYTQDSSEGIYSRLARNVVPCAEKLGLSIGEKEDDQFTTNTGPNSNWTPQMDECFIELMLAQVESVNTAGQVFDDQGWAGIVTSFNENCGQNYDRCIIQNRYTYLMEQYNDVKMLLAQNGFLWDNTQQMVVADDDVWEAYTKVEPQAISYRGIILGHYKALSRIFERTIPDDDIICQRNPGSSFSPTPLLGIDIGEAPNDDHVHTRETEASCERRKRTSETTLAELRERFSKVQKDEDNDMQEAFTEMANVVSKLVKKTTETRYNAIERAVEALQAIPDMDDELLLDACDLMEDEKKAKTFLALDVSLRKKWLLRKLGRC